MNPRTKMLLILLTLIAVIPGMPGVSAQEAIIRAVLFFSPYCQSCHEVMEKALPPLVEKYNGQLDIIGIDVSKPLGLQLYQASISEFDIPKDRRGVPALIVGDVVLVGSREVPEEFPRIIENGLATGGIDWPEIPGLKQVLAAQPESSHQNPENQQSRSSPPPFVNRFANDLLANCIAVVVLLGMIVSTVAVGYSYIKGSVSRFVLWPKWVMPLLSLVGLGVAAYLSFVEFSGSDAICGPVGNCNSVQHSPYAYLFGIVPIGIIGVAGYLAILAAWLLQQYGPQPWRKYFSIGIWLMGWFGVLFSIYLTFLEPFVIGATCAWCIASAVIMALILVASTDSAKKAMEFKDDAWQEYEEE